MQEMLGVILKDGQRREGSVHQLGLAVVSLLGAAAVCRAGGSGTLHLS